MPPRATVLYYSTISAGRPRIWRVSRLGKRRNNWKRAVSGEWHPRQEAAACIGGRAQSRRNGCVYIGAWSIVACTPPRCPMQSRCCYPPDITMRAIVSSVTCYGLRTCMSRYAVTEWERGIVDRALLGCIGLVHDRLISCGSFLISFDEQGSRDRCWFSRPLKGKGTKTGKKVFQNEFPWVFLSFFFFSWSRIGYSFNRCNITVFYDGRM